MGSFELVLLIVLLACLSFLSVLESSIAQLSKLTLRVMAEKQEDGYEPLLEEIARDRRHFLIPLLFGIQVLLVSTAVLVTTTFLRIEDEGIGLLGSLLTMILVVSVFRQLIPYLVTLGKPEKVLLKLIPLFSVLHRVLTWLSFPLTVVMRVFRISHERELALASQEEEATDEEIQAYLGVGEEEGIFESTETRLIQSALEFGNTLVREIMTPRSEIVAIEDAATLAQLRELVVNSKHSRIPVYHDNIDHMVGFVHVRNLLAELDPGGENEPISPIVSEVPVVPETKNVADLLQDMQTRADQIAIVVNEYGTVSGLVTVEDLLEEIVGDIPDEDEFRRVDLMYEGGGSYIVRGGVEVEELEETLGVDFGDYEATTVSGLVVDHLGIVPSPGESLTLGGAQIQILSADDRRIHTIRVRLKTEQEARSAR